MKILLLGLCVFMLGCETCKMSRDEHFIISHGDKDLYFIQDRCYSNSKPSVQTVRNQQVDADTWYSTLTDANDHTGVAKTITRHGTCKGEPCDIVTPAFLQ